MEFPKMARLNREVVITEKIDGTNAQIIISQRDGYGGDLPENLDPEATEADGFVVLAASRTRLIVPGKQDNAGFAGWVKANRAELLKLGPGRHFGEWWGANIQRRYGLDHKRFSLFNVGRWFPLRNNQSCQHDDSGAFNGRPGVYQLIPHPEANLAICDLDPIEVQGPACCHVVPTIWRGNFSTFRIEEALTMLRGCGSFAAPGFRDPEGIVIYHEAAKKCFKVTLENDEKRKSDLTNS